MREEEEEIQEKETVMVVLIAILGFLMKTANDMDGLRCKKCKILT